MPTKVLVIGGSVGGVSTAVALKKSGCDVLVLERAAAVVATTGAVSACHAPKASFQRIEDNA